MKFQKGNTYAKGKKHAQKLKTDELKEMAYEQYCEHLAKGKSKKSWYFEHPDLTLTWQTMETYIQNDRFFNPQKKEIAISKGMAYWESVVEQTAEGINKEANVACLQMLMRNKFGWDKEDPRKGESSEPMVKKLAKMWRGDFV